MKLDMVFRQWPCIFCNANAQFRVTKADTGRCKKEMEFRCPDCGHYWATNNNGRITTSRKRELLEYGKIKRYKKGKA